MKGCVVVWSGLRSSKGLMGMSRGAMNPKSCFKARWGSELFASSLGSIPERMVREARWKDLYFGLLVLMPGWRLW